MIVTDFLDAQFAAVMDYNFTASVEKEFDEIAMGEKSWPEMIRSFYDEFHSKVDEALESKPVKSSQMHELGIDPKSGKPVFVKIGRFGPVAQIGGAEGDEEKPRFASLKKGQLIEMCIRDSCWAVRCCRLRARGTARCSAVSRSMTFLPRCVPSGRR